MNETEFRIFDILARNLGRQLSIQGIADEVEKAYGKGYYKNIYDATLSLEKEGLLRIQNSSGSRFAQIDFDSPSISLALTEMEIKRTQQLIKKPLYLALFKELEWQFTKHHASPPWPIESASIIEDSKSLALNKAELLFILRDSNPAMPFEGGRPTKTSSKELAQQTEDERKLMYDYARFISTKTNIKISFLSLTAFEFASLLISPELNPLKDMLKLQIAVIKPSSYWLQLVKMHYDGMNPAFQSQQCNPAKLSREEIQAIFSGFGYREFGANAKPLNYSLETAIAAALMQEDARLLEAIPIILAKNQTLISYPMLEYLGMKHGKLNLFGYLLSLAINTSSTLKSNLKATSAMARIASYLRIKKPDKLTPDNWDVRLRITPSDIAKKMSDYDADR
ncbi:MAG: hypothetical protein ABH863_03760 [Candidatus Micrarchaeota archaeon]